MTNNFEDIIDELSEISDEMMEREWRQELGINDGIQPIEDVDDFGLELPDFEMEEDELLINRQD